MKIILHNLFKVTARYGAIAGMLGAVLAIVLYFIGLHPLLFPIYFDFRVALFGIFIFFALREYRVVYGEGLLSMWQGMLGGLMFVMVYAIVSALLLYGFALANADFVTSFKATFARQAKNFPPDVVQQIGHDKLDQMMAALKETTAIDLVRNYFMQNFPIATLVSIVVSVIARRQVKL